jgi:2-keto-3-deoxy-L-rhamnonate aldolase RhmA
MRRPIQLPPNPLRKKLSSGGLAVGSVITTMVPNMMYAACFAGLDFVRIDAEHQWVRDTNMEFVIQTALHGGTCPIVRVDRDDDYMPRKILELGAGGLIFPQMEAVDDVVHAVKTTKFPPRGIRGYSSICWAGGWGAKSSAEWVQWSDREPLVGIMIETAATASHLEAMIAVDGVDFVLFGPSDYSMSLGLRRSDEAHSEVAAALENTISTARRHGKPVMMGLGRKNEDIIRLRDMGVTMFEIDHDVGIMRAFWSEKVDFVESIQANATSE